MLYQEFFLTYGLSSQHVKMIAGMGLMVTCFTLALFLVFLCSRKLRDQHHQVKRSNKKFWRITMFFEKLEILC